MSELKTGILILNLGTPNAPDPDSVGKYLNQFLMDKWVIDIPALLRLFLVKVLIVPKRKFASSHAYKQVWTERGSPLAFHSHDLVAALQKEFPEAPLVLGMRYGEPSIASALKRLKAAGAERIVVFPQYPQYAESSVRTGREECELEAEKIGFSVGLKFIAPFYDHPEFIKAYAEIIRPILEREKPDHLLLSYHGLPERHVKRMDSSGTHCLRSLHCCDMITDANRLCYRAHSFATTRALAKTLNLKPETYSVSFQSRLGRTPWIKPFTDFVIKELPAKGVKHLAVVTPSFTADCLETIEEIGIRAKEDFLASGGQKFTRIPCLNSEEVWIKGAANILRENLR